MLCHFRLVFGDKTVSSKDAGHLTNVLAEEEPLHESQLKKK
jgi:hypothetical protein